MLKLFLLLVNVGVIFATLGVDVSQRTYLSSWQCLKSSGYNFAIVRVYQSNGKCDPNGPASISDAWNGGMAHVDGYIFPCYSCGNPAKQMDDTIDYLAANSIFLSQKHALEANQTVKATVGMLWIDVEGPQSSYWGPTAQENVAFLDAMVQEGLKRGVSLGIYSSASQWNPIMGSSTQFSYLPLWYPHYDNNPSYSDWVSFGGWSKPSIKQYIGTTSICSASVDKNFY